MIKKKPFSQDRKENKWPFFILTTINFKFMIENTEKSASIHFGKSELNF